jgi:hypothetical protein
MRIFHQDIIEEIDFGNLLSLEMSKKRHDFDVAMGIPSFKAIMDKIEEDIPETPIWGFPSYYRVERRLKAHALHFDGCKLDGSPNHMSWCRYSAVSVLTESWDKGTLRFYDPLLELGSNLYRSLIVYSSGADNSPQAHERDEVIGDRAALLLFIATKESQ